MRPGNTLTIRGSRLDSAQQSEDVQVALGTRENGNVQSRGEVNGLRLFKVIVVEESDVTFAPTTVNTTTQSSSFPAPAQAAVQTQASETQASQTLTPQILTLGNSVAEGESPVASSVVRADVFSPAPRVDSSAASTLESDVETPLVSVESPTDVAHPVSGKSIDTAFADRRLLGRSHFFVGKQRGRNTLGTLVAEMPKSRHSSISDESFWR